MENQNLITPNRVVLRKIEEIQRRSIRPIILLLRYQFSIRDDLFTQNYIYNHLILQFTTRVFCLLPILIIYNAKLLKANTNLKVAFKKNSLGTRYNTNKRNSICHTYMNKRIQKKT